MENPNLPWNSANGPTTAQFMEQQAILEFMICAWNAIAIEAATKANNAGGGFR